jgi:N-acetyl-anhydromuramyl-L-alanine amidase AmpD
MQFIPAANFTHHPSARDINLLVIHDMEAPERSTTAEAAAQFFHDQPRSSTSGSSAHYCIDNNSIVQCVRDHDIAWAAPGANHDGLHFEHAGYASQTKHDWADHYSTAMLRRSAELVARKARRYHIPIRFLTADEVRAGHAGITGHLQITQSGIGGAAGSHTDPGSNFPWHRYIRYVKAFAAGEVPADFVAGEVR